MFCNLPVRSFVFACVLDAVVSAVQSKFMKMTRICFGFCAGIMLGSLSAGTVCAADDEPQPPANRPDREALRERVKNLSPEERQKMIKEFRERNGLGRTNQSEWEKKREEFRSLPPEERAARMRELRESMRKEQGGFRLLTLEQREAKRGEMKARVDIQIGELRAKKADGTITDAERRRLERMEQVSERLAKSARPERPLPPPRSEAGKTGLPEPRKDSPKP